MRWLSRPIDKALAIEFERALGCGRVLAELLVRLGLPSVEAATRFLQPRLSDLEDPLVIPRLDLAAGRILAARERGEAVGLIGDYDVDGVTSTALLTHLLRRLGLSARFVVPRRMEDGYGLSRSAIDRLLEEGRPGLVVALDCGTNSTAEVAYLRGLGIDVIILDHHRSKGATPAECILVNPHTAEPIGRAPGTHLCTVGLAFKLAHALLKRLRHLGDRVTEEIRLRDYLDLVALGTVADLVPLLGENRILARGGLAILENGVRPGLRTLMEVAGIDPAAGIKPVDISFKLGPRINASGRLADASLAVELILSDQPEFCHTAAGQLDAWNRERQELERAIVDQVDALVTPRLPAAHGLVVFDEQWHPGVVGIVASRVCRKYARPSIVLGLDGDHAKGSGRSVAGLNLVQVLGDCDQLLENWGGHPMAVGISLRRENVPAFIEAFDAAVRARFEAADFEPELAVSAWVGLEELNEDLLRELDRLHPFGEGNREPVLGVRGVVLRQPPEVFKEHHFRFVLHDAAGRRLFGVAWKMADRLPPVGVRLDLCVLLKWNFFGGRQLLQAELVDWRQAEAA